MHSKKICNTATEGIVLKFTQSTHKYESFKYAWIKLFYYHSSDKAFPCYSDAITSSKPIYPQTKSTIITNFKVFNSEQSTPIHRQPAYQDMRGNKIKFTHFK